LDGKPDDPAAHPSLDQGTEKKTLSVVLPTDHATLSLRHGSINRDTRLSITSLRLCNVRMKWGWKSRQKQYRNASAGHDKKAYRTRLKQLFLCDLFNGQYATDVFRGKRNLVTGL
jgi:hypothetical protein